MLRTRVITALVLLAIILPTVFLLPPWVWGLVSLVFLCAGASEWLTLLHPDRSSVLGSGVVLVLGLAWLAAEQYAPGALRPAATLLLVLAATYWLLVAPWRLRAGDVRRGGAPIALVLLFACWIALVELRRIDIAALIAALMIVWIADVGAYFVGKSVGRRKLAPAISPGKSVEGAVGGAILVAIIGLVGAASPALKTTLPAELVSGWGPVLAAIVLMALAALSVVGDLHESLLKRQAQVKDSGWLLPGHGGVLDRIDALVPCMPLVILLHWSLVR